MQQHIKDAHPELFAEYLQLMSMYEARRGQTEVECPICGQRMKQLSKHLLSVHGYTNLEQFKQDWPEYPLTAYKPKAVQMCVCPICRQEFQHTNTLGIHLKRTHSVEPAIKDRSGCKYVCGICGFQTNGLYDHVLYGHHMDWADYCSMFHHPHDEKAYHSPEHNQRVSKAKIAYYQTEEGQRRRQQQSQACRGENNVSKRPEVRTKISSIQAAYVQQDTLRGYTRFSNGIRFKCPAIGLNKFTRSYQEYRIALTCYHHGIEYQFEPGRLSYVDAKGITHFYIPDFYIDNVYYEIKPSEKQKSDPKYLAVKQANPQITLHLVTYPEMCKQLGIEPLTETQILQTTKQLLGEGEMQISYLSIGGRNSRFLQRLDPDYQNNPFINFNDNHMEILKW